MDLYDASGKNTKLSPYTTGTSTFSMTAAGSVKMLSWLNRGYRYITKLKLPDGTNVKFPVVEGDMFFKTAIVEGLVTSFTKSTGVAQLDGSAGDGEDQYNGWLISIEGGAGEGQARLVVNSNGGHVRPHVVWDTDLDETSEYMLYKRFVLFLLSNADGASENISMDGLNDIVNIHRLTDVGMGIDLEYAGRTANFPSGIVSSGRPGAWFSYSRGIYFDVAPKEEIWYRMEYEKSVTKLTTQSQEPEIPDPWQEALFLWLVWKARVWSFEPSAAYGAKRDFFDFARSIQLPLETQMDRSEGGFEPDLGG
jgi:hypothetical protein